MDHPEELDISELLEAMISRLKAGFPVFKTVEEYAGFKGQIATPALAVEISSIEQAEEGRGGTGQLDVTLHCSAYVLVSYKTVSGKKPKLRAVMGAASLMAFVENERWGQPVGQAEEIGAYPDEIHGNQEYEVWRVDWQHSAIIGVSETKEDAIDPPAEVYLGYAPRIGPGNEEHYQRIDTLPEVEP